MSVLTILQPSTYLQLKFQTIISSNHFREFCRKVKDFSQKRVNLKILMHTNDLSGLLESSSDSSFDLFDEREQKR